MSASLRIVVADDDSNMSEYFQDCLGRLGHQVVAVAQTGRELIEHCGTLLPDLVITDIKMPDLDGLDAATQIYQQRPVPIILVSAHHDVEFIERARANQVLAYLVKPIKQSDLGPAIAIAMARFEQFQAICQEAADLRQALADRKVIERAKGTLMKKVGLDEQQAYQRLQKLASDKGRKMVEIAHMILAMEEAFQPPQES